MIETPAKNHRTHVEFIEAKFRAWEDRQEELLEMKLYEFWGIAEEDIQQLKDTWENEKQLIKKEQEETVTETYPYYVLGRKQNSLDHEIAETFFKEVWKLTLGTTSFCGKDKTFGPNGIECRIVKSPNNLFTEGGISYYYKNGGCGGGYFNFFNNHTAFETLEEAQEEVLTECISIHKRQFDQYPEDTKQDKLIKHLQSLLNTIKGGVVKEASGQLTFF